MFTSKQRNSIFNINKFTREKNVNNLIDVNINNEANTFNDTKFKIIKLIMFNDN